LYSCARARRSARLLLLLLAAALVLVLEETNTAECYLNAFYRFEITPAFSKSSLQYLWIVDNIKQSKGMTPSVTILKALFLNSIL
jgi:hypothetical protein